MQLPNNATSLLVLAFRKMLGKPAQGSVAFVRCLPAEVIVALARDASFDLGGWKVAVVAGEADLAERRITADVAVEWREDKADPILLLVDTDTAGAGMDGIYSAARELGETQLFEVTMRQAQERLPHGSKGFVDAARRKARRSARNLSLSPWQEFSYLCRAIEGQRWVGAALPALGLWPIDTSNHTDEADVDRSARLVERLLPRLSNPRAADARVSALQMPTSQAADARDLVKFLGEAERLTRLDALKLLETKENLWINRLTLGVFETQSLVQLTWVPWQGRLGRLLSWSGLVESADQRLEFLLTVGSAGGNDANSRA